MNLDFSSILIKRSRSDDSTDESASSQKLAKSSPQPKQYGLYRSQMTSYGWITRPSHIDMMDFALDNLPSTWDNGRVAWICLRNYPSLPTLSSSETSTFRNDNERKQYCGKWMWFVPECVVDEKFIMLAEALQSGLLGDSLKVPPVSCVQKFGDLPDNDREEKKANNSTSSSDHESSISSSTASIPINTTGELKSTGVKQNYRSVPFIIYTKDFRDREDVLRVGKALRNLGISKTLSYKPDIFTTSEEGIYGKNQLPKSIYQLKVDSEVLTLTDNGNAFDIAVAMVVGNR